MIDKQEIDITDAIAYWSIPEIIKLLKLLEENGCTNLIFDGYNASIAAFKKPKTEHERF